MSLRASFAAESVQVNPSEPTNIISDVLAKGVYHDVVRPLHAGAGLHDALLAVIDRLSAGVIIVDARLKILSSSAPARKILERIGVYELDACFAPGGLKTQLEKLVASSLEDGREASAALITKTGEPSSIVVSCQMVEPAQPAAAILLALWFVDVEAVCPDCTWLRPAYGLTRGEHAVVYRLVMGCSLEEIAEALSISVATVRTHLHLAYGKTGVTSQARLVRLASAMPTGAI